MRKLALAAASALVLLCGAGARAASFTGLYVFGDSYSDTGAYVRLTNGSTAAGYLAQGFGIPLVAASSASPGTSGVNFAETGARVDVAPPPPAAQPHSLTQQVAELQSFVAAGKASFDPARTLFFLAGGLNDHTNATQAQIAQATAAQVATLYGLGARYIEIALLPSLIPPFADSAANLNPVYTALVPQLQAQYGDAVIRLSNWGAYYDDILLNPGQYGITNTTDACFNNAACTDPNSYFYYYAGHPSDRAHQIVGAKLYQEALALPAAAGAVPEPATWGLMVTGFGMVGAGMRRRRITVTYG